MHYYPVAVFLQRFFAEIEDKHWTRKRVATFRPAFHLFISIGGRGLTGSFDIHEIRGGDDWQHLIHQGLANARFSLAFILRLSFSADVDMIQT